jgi:hypothetical protein
VAGYRGACREFEGGLSIRGQPRPGAPFGPAAARAVKGAGPEALLGGLPHGVEVDPDAGEGVGVEPVGRWLPGHELAEPANGEPGIGQRIGGRS